MGGWGYVRIDAIVRRSIGHVQSIIQTGDLVLNLDALADSLARAVAAAHARASVVEAAPHR